MVTEHVISGFTAISEQLANREKPDKPKMLVVDDEPDNIDLLFRTFRRSFQVLKAENGLAALNVLAQEGEVAVIISDQRMPEMKGTEFLRRTVPQFPDTVRIILTGFTDVEDLVEAINSGQVYKYITKPWDADEMRTVVQQATETYELCKQRSGELERAHAQSVLFNALVQATRDYSDCDEFLQATAIALGKGFMTDRCVLQLVKHGELTAQAGVYRAIESSDSELIPQALAELAIANQELQGIVDQSAPDSDSPKGNHSQLVVPIVFQQRVLAVLSLQWQNSCPLEPDALTLIYLATQQVSFTLGCTHCCHDS